MIRTIKINYNVSDIAPIHAWFKIPDHGDGMKPKKEHPTDTEKRDTPFNRFKNSMMIDYEKWHDGIGYDIEAVREAKPNERDAIEKLLLNRSPLDWRDIEALAELGSTNSRKALLAAFHNGDAEERIGIIRYAPELVSEIDYLKTLVEALQTTNFNSGLSQTLNIVEHYHPPEVVEELFRGVLNREGTVAVHFAAMLFFIHGKTDSPFHIKYRSFFLRFNTNNAKERRAAYLELRQMLATE
jgi:hypothetical protein